MAEWLTPITDRTEADTVEAFNNQMIEEHLKGALNYSDLNRIENNYKYLIENLQKNGYYINHKYRNYTETEPVVTAIEVPGEPGSAGGIVDSYLQSSGTQYIDPGISIPKSQAIDLRVECDCEWLNPLGDNGVGSVVSGNIFWFGCYNNTIYYGNGTTDVTLSQKYTGGRATWILDAYNKEFSVSGIVSLTGLTFKTPTVNGTFPIPARGNGIRIYGTKIYKAGTLIRDFVPKLDDNGVACLYDKVEGKYYYNAGTGSFAYGENVYYPVQYIESSGTQYINTGFTHTSENAKVEISFAVTSVTSASSWHTLFGSEGSSYGLTAYINNGAVRLYAGSADKEASHSIVLNNRYNLVATGKNNTITSTINGVTQSASYNGTMQNGLAMALFANNSRSGVMQYASIRLYSCKIYENDVLVRDYVPWIDENGTACLKDKVSNTYYYNAGTGTFNAGAPISSGGSDPTYEYVVEYVQNTYTEWFEQNLPWKSEIDRIRDNFNNLIKEYLPKSNIKTINKNQYFKFSEANKIEDVSAYTKGMTENMEYNFIRCGEVNSGGERLL